MDNVEELLHDALSFPPEHDESLLGILAGETERAVPTEDWVEAREEAWSIAVRSDWRTEEMSDHGND